jgi:hypothetical protein
MEWLFIVTKPSFINILALPKKIEILLFFGSCSAIACSLLLLPFLILTLFPWFNKYKYWLVLLGGLLPALILASLLLLMIDNFTYTIFKFGIVSTKGVSKTFYTLLFIILTIFCYRKIVQTVNEFGRKWVSGFIQKRLSYLFIGLILVSFAFPMINNDVVTSKGDITNNIKLKNLPNILLITMDGLDASHLSTYGYQRETDPRIRQLASSSLVAENNFPNSSVTASSIVSIYTGKYASYSRFFYPPNILRGVNAYQHFPGILRSLGYYTVQITTPYYVDAVTFNLLDGFDISNGLKISTSRVLSTINKYISTDFAYFSYELGNRIVDRLLHIFFIKDMKNSIETVTNPEIFNDPEKVKEIINLFNSSQQPLFIHVHLMGTHGDKFLPTNQVFSKGQSIDSQGSFNQDFYDDSILDADQEIGQIVDNLESKNLFDKTILIIGTDHGQQWTETHRIPLIIRFPNGEHAGTIKKEVQNLDIAPTIFEYLGLSKPDWMSGQSLLHLNPTPQPIISLSPAPTKRGDEGWVLDQSKIKPPFYDLGVINVVYCQKWYKLNLLDRTWQTGEVIGDTFSCPGQSSASEKYILSVMETHLKKAGYDVSSLTNFNPDLSRVDSK